MLSSPRKLLDSLHRPTMAPGFLLLTSGTGIKLLNPPYIPLIGVPYNSIPNKLSVNVRQELVNFMENQGYQWIGTAGAPVPTIFHSNSPHHLIEKAAKNYFRTSQISERKLRTAFDQATMMQFLGSEITLPPFGAWVGDNPKY